MKDTRQEGNALHVSPELLAEVLQAAGEEHRRADELVTDAVRRYLDERRQHALPPHANLAQLLMASPFAGANLDLERRKDYPGPVEL